MFYYKLGVIILVFKPKVMGNKTLLSRSYDFVITD